jgi:hypothetical protein
MGVFNYLTTLQRMRWTWLILIILLHSFNKVQARDGIYPYIEGGKIGFKNLQDSVIVAPIYDYYEPFHPTHNITVIGLGKYERLNYNDSERQVKFIGKFGLIDSTGREVIPPSFDIIFQIYDNYTLAGFGEGHLRFSNWPEGKEIFFKGRMGVVRHDGKTIIPFSYNEIRKIVSPSKPYWLAFDDQLKSHLYYDSVMLELREDIVDISDFSEGRAKILVNTKYGFIDTTGAVVVDPVYDQAKNYSSGKVFLKKENEYLWLDRSGRIIEGNKQIIFDETDPFSEGFARVKIFDEYGYIYSDSSFFKFPEFTEATPFFNQLASVRGPKSFGYIFTDGTEDIVDLYDSSRLINIQKEIVSEQNLNFTYPMVNSNDTAYYFKSIDTLTLEKLITFQAEALRWAPYLYFNYPNMLPRVSAGEGTLAGRFLFGMSFLEPGNEIWENLKQNVLLKLFSNEKNRVRLWKSFIPLFKYSFQSMPELHQKVYLKMIDYLEEYFSEYDIAATRKFLLEKEDYFAYEHPDGSSSPYRKASAQIDRFILIYEIISVEEVQKWIRKIKKEVYKW